MTAGDQSLNSPARSVVREIDRELERLEKLEKAVASERDVLLAARAALTVNGSARQSLRRRVSRAEVVAYVGNHPGRSVAEIVEALQATATSVSTHLHRGKHTRYEYRDDGWYLRAGRGAER